MNKILEIMVGLIPTETLAAIVAKLVTKAMQGIKDRARAMKVAVAASAVAEAAHTASDAAKDCEVTADEVDAVAYAVKFAIEKVGEACK